MQTPPRHIPRPVEYRPGPQLVQLSLVAMLISDQLPAGHSAHCKNRLFCMKSASKQEKCLTSLAAVGAYRPLAQLLHPPDPFTLEIVPKEHA